jgi:2-polyprenyl-6-methoxyphenol hydroxylase-like FAD-dependent oxidoreductase
MTRTEQSLIVGAGPVGLGAGLFLAQQGHFPRIVEMRHQPDQISKALAVNPRTLDILEPTGVTRQMLERGLAIPGVRFHRRGRIVGGMSFDGMHPRYPFMLGLSQATTEHLLAQALEAAGGRVERGIKLVACRNLDNWVEAALEPTTGGSREVDQYHWLLAADGAHSLVREQLGIDFVGSSFANEWHLADAPLRTALAEDQAHVFLLEGGEFLFVIRVVDDARQSRAGEHLWRVFGNRPEPLSRLVEAEQVGPPVWTSSFHISHRINTTFSPGHTYFAGDAAHVHSPAGARGMNLGLEDAWVFAELVRTDRLADYDQLRRPVDRRVVGQVEMLSRVVAAESPWYRLLRALLFPAATRIPFIRSRMMATLTGLDHPLPELDGTRQGSRHVHGPVSV